MGFRPLVSNVPVASRALRYTKQKFFSYRFRLRLRKRADFLSISFSDRCLYFFFGFDSLQRRSAVQLVGHQYERDSESHGRGGLVEPRDISQQLRHQRRVLPVRRATLRPEMGLLDVRWIPSEIPTYDQAPSPPPLSASVIRLLSFFAEA